MATKMVCPNGCNAYFSTIAHIAQDWIVDAFGNFVGSANDSTVVTHNPHFGNLWTCMKCGAEGQPKDIPGDGSDNPTEIIAG